MKQLPIQMLAEQLKFNHKEAYNDLYEFITVLEKMEKENLAKAFSLAQQCDSDCGGVYFEYDDPDSVIEEVLNQQRF
jgi:hypothetical protein